MTTVSSSSLFVDWDDLPEDNRNGVLLGYKVRWRMVGVSGIALIDAAQGYSVKEVDKYSTELVLTGLQSYSSYTVTVSAYTADGEGPQSIPLTRGNFVALF